HISFKPIYTKNTTYTPALTSKPQNKKKNRPIYGILPEPQHQTEKTFSTKKNTDLKKNDTKKPQHPQKKQTTHKKKKK
ncbi:hypothetical protein, partial [Acinetobacter baumannii]